MKKKIFGGIAIAALVFTTSCTGDYDCVCTVSGQTYTANSWSDVKKADAQNSCDAIETNTQILSPSASCSLEKQ